MCWILTLAVPPGCELPVTTRGLQIRPCDAAGFPPGWSAFEVTAGICACSLYAQPEAGNLKASSDSLRERYRRKGWSAAKINRALRDREDVQSRRARRANSAAAFRERVMQWVEEYGAVCIRADWQGREHEKTVLAATRQELSAEAFRRNGFPPHQLLRIDGRIGSKNPMT